MVREFICLMAIFGNIPQTYVPFNAGMLSQNINNLIMGKQNRKDEERLKDLTQRAIAGDNNAVQELGGINPDLAMRIAKWKEEERTNRTALAATQQRQSRTDFISLGKRVREYDNYPEAQKAYARGLQNIPNFPQDRMQQALNAFTEKSFEATRPDEQPLTQIGKLAADLDEGRITKEQFNIGMDKFKTQGTAAARDVDLYKQIINSDLPDDQKKQIVAILGGGKETGPIIKQDDAEGMAENIMDELDFGENWAGRNDPLIQQALTTSIMNLSRKGYSGLALQERAIVESVGKNFEEIKGISEKYGISILQAIEISDLAEEQNKTTDEIMNELKATGNL